MENVLLAKAGVHLTPTAGSFNFHSSYGNLRLYGDFHFYVLITSKVEQIGLLLMIQENYLS